MGLVNGLVGRERQLDELGEVWSAARAGHGRFAVVTGPAGIGKTRLLEVLAERARRSGVVAWGACAGQDSPALAPWRAVLRSLGAPVDHPGDDMPAGDLVERAASHSHRFARIVDSLHHAAATAPVLVVLDDAHWADPDSIRVLRLVAAEVRQRPVSLVVSCRPDEPAATQNGLRDVLTDLASGSTIVGLSGLGADAVAELVAAFTGQQSTPELTAAVVERTGGNPFFVRELMRLLVAEGDLHAAIAGRGVRLPPVIRDVLLRRVALLSVTARDALEAAAIIGREAPSAAIAAVGGLSDAALSNAVDEVEAARLVDVVDGRVRFEHDLVREALLDDLDAASRRRLHLAAGEALAALGSPLVSPGEVAGHLLDALPLGDPHRAANAALAAGRESLERHAPTDALRQLERGLAAVEGLDSLARGELLLTLGDARSTAGDRAAARAAYEAAADLARAAGDVDLLAASALGFAGVMASTRGDPARVALLEEALTALGDRRDGLAARVHARLAHALIFSDDRDRRQQLADDAVAMARELGDPRTLVTTLYSWCIVSTSVHNFPERMARADELLALGRASGDLETEAVALHIHAHHVAEAGAFATFDADVAEGAAMAHRARDATWQWTALVHRAMRAVMQGRFDEGEALGNQAFELGRTSQQDVAPATFGAHLVALRTWQGRVDELLSMIVGAADRFPGLPAVWASVPFALAEVGRLDEAAEELRRLTSTHRLEQLPDAHSWTVAMAMLARAAHLTGDADVARRVRDLLRPLEGRHVLGPFADCYYGPAYLYVGLCEVATGDLDDARAHLQRAIYEASAVGARPVVAWATAELAAVLERGGREPRLAAELRSQAAVELAELGMKRHLERLVGDRPSTLSNEFRRTDDGWSLTYGGRTVTMPPSKGLTDVHRLVSAPNVEVHVLELADETGGAPLRAARGEPVLDERAKAEFRRRIVELDAEIADATACADLARAERAEVERDQVLAALAEALGLGGRDRRLTDEAERARQAVRARIRYAVDRVGQVHPQLGHHLERSLVTGAFCAYRPDREVNWTTT